MLDHILNLLSSPVCGGSRGGRGSIDRGKDGGRLWGGQQRAGGSGPLLLTVLRERSVRRRHRERGSTTYAAIVAGTERTVGALFGHEVSLWSLSAAHSTVGEW